MSYDQLRRGGLYTSRLAWWTGFSVPSRATCPDMPRKGLPACRSMDSRSLRFPSQAPSPSRWSTCIHNPTGLADFCSTPIETINTQAVFLLASNYGALSTMQSKLRIYTLSAIAYGSN
jgi:hypothetical protein